LTFHQWHASTTSKDGLKSKMPERNGLSSSTVIILKKMQGSVWREAGRTGICPTPEWLTTSFGNGEYELRLKTGNRVVCMVGVDTEAATRRHARVASAYALAS
jgi:hypothetical protein